MRRENHAEVGKTAAMTTVASATLLTVFPYAKALVLGFAPHFSQDFINRTWQEESQGKNKKRNEPAQNPVQSHIWQSLGHQMGVSTNGDTPSPVITHF